MDLTSIQSALRESHLDGWLFYDHHHRDPLAYRILALPVEAMVTRRWFYFIPAAGEPQKLVHRIESARLDALPGKREEYSSWQEMERQLTTMIDGAQKIAVQYSPRNAIPAVAMVDAGTIDLLREFGKQIVTSADLVSRFEAVLTESQIATHFAAQQKVDRILAAAWQEIASRIHRDGSTDEFAMVTWLREAIAREGLFTDHGPNVSAGPNSADPHYDPTPTSSRPIRSSDFLLIDLWAKLASDPTAIWYDITWTAVIGREPTEREQQIFRTVRTARDAAIAAVVQAFAHNQPIAGWQADAAARSVIAAAGFAECFTHRTGHNIGADLHGSGAHLDDLETHDTRLILPNTCFSVEPGIYLPGEFGIRSEVNMIARPGSAAVTGPMQRDLIRIG